MLIDFVIGVIGLEVGLLLGYEWNSLFLFCAAFIADSDIIVNEFYRIFIKKEKKFGVKNFLDECSYTHKFWFHVPLVSLPVVFFAGYLYLDFVFAVLIFVMVLLHFLHDTVDNNFDGVYWAWPFNSKSYKIKKIIIMVEEYVLYSPPVAVRKTVLEVRSRDELKQIAQTRAMEPRDSKKIIKDNTII